jgi:hypothetical protein
MQAKKSADKEAMFMECLEAWQSYQGTTQQTLDLLKGESNAQVKWFCSKIYKQIFLDHLQLPDNIQLSSAKSSISTAIKKIHKGTDYGYEVAALASNLNKFLKVMHILQVISVPADYR